ncbi:hypothetical protein ACQKND_16785 [Viridibacillus arvi]|uniref:hypothetical protein n=1 Tax=Viridibacillus arvi TaxID=263475 RepID=UPI003CFDB33D
MTKVLNLGIWFLFFILFVTLFYIVLAFIKNKQRKYITRALLIFLTLLLTIVAFYFPVKNPLQQAKQVTFTIENGESEDKLESKKVNEIKQIIQNQHLIKNTSKTLVGTSPYPFNEGINIHISGNEISFNMLVFIRIDNPKESYVEYNSQYYSILKSDKFVQDIVKVINRLES